ncbi:MAG TPA: DOMON-like domain-containing protein [Allosphingosinicella sp.]|nr:DOMON-like domain-containing protein [Allosphingosinicella sp.]
MRLSLRPHPVEHGKAVATIEVTVERPAVDRLRLTYAVRGKTDDLVLPAPRPPLRSHGLWETTCFEAFLRSRCETAYREFNFSPSGEWAATLLRYYRDLSPPDAALPANPEIQLEALGPDSFELRVDLRTDLPSGPCRLNLAAVIEERDGTKSYWALAHWHGKPDFHHRACFVLELPPAEQP